MLRTLLCGFLVFGFGCSDEKPLGNIDAGPIADVATADAAPGDAVTKDGTSMGNPYQGYHAHTLKRGESDNAEVIKVLSGGEFALLVSSKSRKIALLRIAGGKLTEVRSRALFPQDTSESELSHIAADSTSSWAVVTRTLPQSDQGTITGCAGELVFVDIKDAASFGDVLKQVPVGPMPDSVDISPDNKRVASANERDVVWGKCEGVQGLDPASISIVDVANGPASAKETLRVLMTTNEEREPESIKFSKSGELLVATLQDSHEVAYLDLKALSGKQSASDADLKIVALPQNSLGQDAWPDGITPFVDNSGTEYFATANEANDSVTLLGADGTIVSNLEILASDIPADYPRDGSWGPLFRPDSIDTLLWKGRSYLVLTLKASGAVAIFDVSDVKKATFAGTIKVGDQEGASRTEESTILPEGISTSNTLGAILTANEGESSVSLILPMP